MVVTPSDLRLVERRAQLRDRVVARLGVRDQLRDQRVVTRPDVVAFLNAGVDADAGRETEPLDPARLRQERPRIFGVEPNLDCVAVRWAGLVEWTAFGDPDLVAR